MGSKLGNRFHDLMDNCSRHQDNGVCVNRVLDQVQLGIWRFAWGKTPGLDLDKVEMLTVCVNININIINININSVICAPIVAPGSDRTRKVSIPLRLEG